MKKDTEVRPTWTITMVEVVRWLRKVWRKGVCEGEKKRKKTSVINQPMAVTGYVLRPQGGQKQKHDHLQ